MASKSKSLTVEQLATNYITKLSREMRAGVLSLLVLAAVESSGEPTYGYRLIKDMQKATVDRLDIKEGTVYPLLRGLEAAGLLESVWQVPMAKQKRGRGVPRCYYSITGAGRLALAKGRDQWGDFIDIVAPVLIKEEGEE